MVSTFADGGSVVVSLAVLGVATALTQKTIPNTRAMMRMPSRTNCIASDKPCVYLTVVTIANTAAAISSKIATTTRSPDLPTCLGSWCQAVQAPAALKRAKTSAISSIRSDLGPRRTGWVGHYRTVGVERVVRLQQRAAVRGHPLMRVLVARGDFLPRVGMGEVGLIERQVLDLTGRTRPGVRASLGSRHMTFETRLLLGLES